jgi:hypothetical protein
MVSGEVDVSICVNIMETVYQMVGEGKSVEKVQMVVGDPEEFEDLTNFLSEIGI